MESVNGERVLPGSELDLALDRALKKAALWQDGSAAEVTSPLEPTAAEAGDVGAADD